MIAVDTNILVYAHRPTSPQHQAARAALAQLAAHGRPWAIPWPCVHEFVAVVTHPRIWSPPTPPADAVAALSLLTGSAEAILLGETRDHLELLARFVGPAGVVGPKVHDARIAAICVGHEVEELWTADRDFTLFPELRTHNPLVATPDRS